MTTPELLEFIRIEHALGMSLSEITQLLINEGEWDMSDVAEAFQTLGLPEEAIESFSATASVNTPKDSFVTPQAKINTDTYNQNSNFNNNNNSNFQQKNGISSNFDSNIINAPLNNVLKNTQQALNLNEQVSEKPKPKLAAPASLKGQVSRNLVRTMSTAPQYAHVNKPRNITQDHPGASIHISKLEDKHSEYRADTNFVSKNGSPLPKPKTVEGSINDIEMALSVGMELAKDEPKPNNVAKNVINSEDKNLGSSFSIGPNGEIKELDNLDYKKVEPNTDLSKVLESSSAFIDKINKEDRELEEKRKLEEERKVKEELEQSVLIEEKKRLEEEKRKLEEEKKAKEFLEQKALADEKKKLEEEKKKLEEEKLKIEEEKKRLEEEKRKKELEEQSVLAEKKSKAEEDLKKKELEDKKISTDFSKILRDSNDFINKINTEDKTLEEKPKEETSANKSQSDSLMPSVDKKVNFQNFVNTSTSENKKDETRPELKTVEVDKGLLQEKKVQDGVVASNNVKTEEAAVAKVDGSGAIDINEPSVEKNQENKNQQPSQPLPPSNSNINQVSDPNSFGAQGFNPYQQNGLPPQYYQPQIQPVFITPPPSFYVNQMQPGFAQKDKENSLRRMPGKIVDSMDEMKSVSDDIDEQAYLAQFGQAKMPEGILRRQPNVLTPNIIYQQMVDHPKPEPAIEKIDFVEKKQEPLRFDIGKLRTSKKTDQNNYSLKSDTKASIQNPTINPLKQEDLEEIDAKINKKEPVGSSKVPVKRTMYSDITGIREGVISYSNSSQNTDDASTFESSTYNVERKVVDDEPLPPPPPKKSSKIMLTVTLISIFTVLILGAAAYYFIVLRLPSSQEVFDKAVAVATRGPAISYDTELYINGTSTSAEPEYISVSVVATGTLNISPREFKDGTHFVVADISHTGIEKPIVFNFDGSILVNEDNVFIQQNKPSKGTVIENVLNSNEWVYTPYNNLGYIFGLATTDSVSTGEYGAITPSMSLYKMLIKNSSITVDGNLSQITEGDKIIYKVPLKMNPNKTILIGDLLSKYFRGTESQTTSASRSEILMERYEKIHGNLYVDKLSMKPIKLEINAKFDPSEVSLNGELRFMIKFETLNQPIEVNAIGKTLDEIKSLRADESIYQSIIANDLPVNTMLPIIKIAISQYNEKFGRYPVSIEDLILGGFLSKESLPESILSRIFYSSYVEKPQDTVNGIRCTGKNIKCDFYHLGANIEYKKSSELNTDSDFYSSMINGNDGTGCRNETNYSCLDFVGEKTN